MGLPGLTECTSVSNIQTNQILMTKQSKKVPAFSNMNLFFLIFIYWAVLGLCCGMKTLFLWSGIKPGPSALGAWSLHHWTTSKVPLIWYFTFQIESKQFLWGKVDFSKLYLFLFYGLLLMWVTRESCAGSGHIIIFLVLQSVSQFSHSVVSDSLWPHEP